MGEQSILIIGANIGGLATGCYAQMNASRAKIVEMHSTPGGFVYIVVAKGHTSRRSKWSTTPMTTERFTSNGHGYHAPISAMALALFTGRRLRGYAGSNTSTGADNGPALVPIVADMGGDIVRDICQRDGRSFAAVQADSNRFQAVERQSLI